MSRDHQRDLSDFTNRDERAPTIHTDEAIRMRIPGKGVTHVGWRGPVPSRNAYGFMQERHSEKHRIRALDAYALSNRVLTRIRSFGCRRVLVAETDTGTVYEFHERQFTDPVPKQYNPQAEDDPQCYVRRTEAWNAWQSHSQDVRIEP